MVTSSCLVLARKERWSGRISADFEIEIEGPIIRGHSRENEIEIEVKGRKEEL
jgi:hypothetical protein